MSNINSQQIKDHFLTLEIPQSDSHKGQNGKLLLIGGSPLFHAASKWSLDTASKFVDMVFYSSVKENNELIKEAKSQFWNGIVVPRNQLESYIDEADCIVIGPGMERVELSKTKVFPEESESTNLSTSPSTGSGFGRDDKDQYPDHLSDKEWEQNTEKIINYLLKKYPDKKWVIDAGALQMVDPTLLNKNCIILPHSGELIRVLEKLGSADSAQSEVESLQEAIENDAASVEQVLKSNELLQKLIHTKATVLFKGKVDCVFSSSFEPIVIKGGSPGMTKGGSGDVLAGLVGSLYCANIAQTSSVVGSYVNKKAGESLQEEVGPFFNSSDLVEAVPRVFWKLFFTPHLKS